MSENEIKIISVTPKPRKLKANWTFECGTLIKYNTKEEWEILAQLLSAEEWDRLVGKEIKREDYL